MEYFSNINDKHFCRHFVSESCYSNFYIQSETETICESISIFSNHNCVVLPIIYLVLINLIYFDSVSLVVPRRAFPNVFYVGNLQLSPQFPLVVSSLYLCICLFVFADQNLTVLYATEVLQYRQQGDNPGARVTLVLS